MRLSAVLYTPNTASNPDFWNPEVALVNGFPEVVGIQCVHGRKEGNVDLNEKTVLCFQ